MNGYLKIIEEDGIKYHACPNCGGSGKVLEAHQYPNGYTEVWVRCEFDYCDRGYIAEDDYLLLKLEGSI